MQRCLAELKKGRQPDVELIAEQVARVINADMGGLHVKRLGRSANLQQLFRLIMLAPDWTESNFSTVTGALGLTPAISRLTGEMPPPPGMGKRYKHFWAGILAKGILSTAMLQMAVWAMFGNDDDEAPWEMWAEQMSTWDTFRRLRWLDVDVTPVYRAVGAKVPAGERRTLSVFRHFKDPLKICEMDRLIKAKASPVARIMTAYMTGSDYRGRPYTNPVELAETGRLVKKSQHQDTENIWARALSTSIAMVRDMQPVQVGYLLKALAGEDDPISAGLGSMGMHMATAYAPDPVRKAYDQAGYDIRKAKRGLKAIQEDREGNKGERIRQYVAENRKLLNQQARLAAAQKRLTALRKAKKQAERIPNETAREKRLETIRKNMTRVRQSFLKALPY